MTNEEFISTILKRCKESQACKSQFKLLSSAKKDIAQFLTILLYNYSWCIKNNIYTAKELTSLNPIDLYKGGWATQKTVPVNFRPVQIGKTIWEPFNKGANLRNLHGEYYQWKTSKNRPNLIETTQLAQRPKMWGIYNSTFGIVVFGDDGNLFFPASGFRNISDGSFNYVGTYGYYWSSVQNGSDGFNLIFHSSYVYPQNNSNRALGFPVRCVKR